MFKRIAMITAFTLTMTSGMAQAAPKNVQECLKSAFLVATDAQKKRLNPATKRLLGQKLKELEGHCGKKRFDQADLIVQALRRLINE